ncbi:hypothetical protein [Sediminibacillus albus]|uniref:Regulatory protein YrvL n=1 Tax=Sediminibacillus albus TaxID=407036 RepID=A0A1G9B934_9BACI|nr:hypothetical protein [Sediminibacillus albus]SDK36027.1 hypothetical protein SAMN05216243_2888 [Sediminibacillus albus]
MGKWMMRKVMALVTMNGVVLLLLAIYVLLEGETITFAALIWVVILPIFFIIGILISILADLLTWPFVYLSCNVVRPVMSLLIHLLFSFGALVVYEAAAERLWDIPFIEWIVVLVAAFSLWFGDEQTRRFQQKKST